MSLAVEERVASTESDWKIEIDGGSDCIAETLCADDGVLTSLRDDVADNVVSVVPKDVAEKGALPRDDAELLALSEACTDAICVPVDKGVAAVDFEDVWLIVSAVVPDPDPLLVELDLEEADAPLVSTEDDVPPAEADSADTDG